MIYDNVSKIETVFSNIYIYQYNNGVKEKVETSIVNYFYIKKEDEEKTTKILNDNGYKYKKIEDNKKSIYNDNLIKIVPDKFEFWKQRKIVHLNDIQTFESSLPEYLKFLLKNTISFTKDRKIGIIDIETQRCLDVDNVPESVLSICIYDYKINKYYVYAWSKNKPCIGRMFDDKELNFYNDEKTMFKNFIKKFKELNLDIVTGWNVENFDFPYIINRMIKLGFKVDELSNFSNGNLKVGTRKIVYNGGKTILYENTIPGIDIIDMIPVMKKANCYSEQPASFSLDSTVRWYLKDEVKMKIDIDCYENDFDKFIDYNIQDVRLVKLLMDKYELITFLYSVHLSMTNGVPLKHCTHNSIVLIYKLKQMFPNIILPDNNGFFKIGDEIINLFSNNIEIKAATVTEPTSGIHENVLSFDFQSLYPTIMRTFNISPDTLDEKGEIEIDDIEMKIINNNTNEEKTINIKKRFTIKRKGIYGKICEYLMTNRIAFKEKMKEATEKYGKDSFEYKGWAYKSDGQKQVLNSLYGVGAYKRFEIFNPFVSAAITSVSRKLIKFINEYCKNKGYTPILSDTDSIYIKVPQDVNEKTMGIELNIAIRDFVLNTWPDLKDSYCLNFMQERSFSKFIIKSAKKKYFGIEKNGNLLVKGFQIVQHSTPKKIKIILQDIFRDLIEQKLTSIEIREKLLKYKEDFKKYKANDIAIELRLANNPEEYGTKTPHAVAATYSNKYLGTNFLSNSIGKFLFVKNIGSIKYPATEYVFLDEDTVLPIEFIIDYNKMWEKLVIDPLKTLKELEELQIEKITSQNKMLEEYI